MKLAVIIPVYNSAATLPAALASIAAQTRRPDEIWLVDDASPDPATQAYLRSLGGVYQGILLKVVFQSKNQGAGAARNRALAATRCELVAFLDADDAWLPAHLAQSVAALAADPSLGFVASNFWAVAPNGTQVLQDCAAISRRTDWLNRHGNPRLQYFYRGFIGILTVVARRDCLQRGGGFRADARYSLDWECWHAALAANPGMGFAVLPEPAALYTLSPGGLTSKTWPRLAERESYLPSFVKNVAHAGGVPWPVLLLRGWLTIQYETLGPLLQRRAFGKVLQLGLRAPLALARLYGAVLRGVPPRRDYLTEGH
ncbi:MAG: glycosyltransferase family 2 protein [Alphaproteobacteria bacterium]|nr:glycosyltransferase family 2 protein [Alphaproteobacteria bacterium]